MVRSRLAYLGVHSEDVFAFIDTYSLGDKAAYAKSQSMAGEYTPRPHFSGFNKIEPSLLFSRLFHVVDGPSTFLLLSSFQFHSVC